MKLDDAINEAKQRPHTTNYGAVRELVQGKTYILINQADGRIIARLSDGSGVTLSPTLLADIKPIAYEDWQPIVDIGESNVTDVF